MNEEFDDLKEKLISIIKTINLLEQGVVQLKMEIQEVRLKFSNIERRE